MLKLLKGNWHVFMVNLYIRLEKKMLEKLEMDLAKGSSLEGSRPASPIRYACRSVVFEFANKRALRHLNKAENLLKQLED